MSRTLELSIDSIAAGGDGVGRANGLVVFVPRSAPGDHGRVRIDKAGRFARGRWEAIDRAGPARIEPPCAHYRVDRCGGCQLQHLDYDAQLDAKADIIRDAIQRIAKRPVGRPAVRPSPTPWRYRRKLTLALRRRAVGGKWIAGLHPHDDPAKVFDLVDCPITDERVIAVWMQIGRASHLLPTETELRGAVQIGGVGGASFLLQGGRRWPHHADFFDSVPLIESLWWQPPDEGRRRLAARTIAPNAQDVPESRSDDFGHVEVAAPSDPDSGNSDTSFVQVNAAVAAELHAHVVARALARHPATVVDAYAGSGDTAVPLAAAGIRVTAIELDRSGAERGARRLSPPSRMIRGRVEETLAAALPADLVILNPPRTGLDARVPGMLAEGPSPAALIYVSCNPATLARDLARLPGYRLEQVVAFDMFPQTAHVETVCELVRESA